MDTQSNYGKSDYNTIISSNQQQNNFKISKEYIESLETLDAMRYAFLMKKLSLEELEKDEELMSSFDKILEANVQKETKLSNDLVEFLLEVHRIFLITPEMLEEYDIEDIERYLNAFVQRRKKINNIINNEKYQQETENLNCDIISVDLDRYCNYVSTIDGQNISDKMIAISLLFDIFFTKEQCRQLQSYQIINILNTERMHRKNNTNKILYYEPYFAEFIRDESCKHFYLKSYYTAEWGLELTEEEFSLLSLGMQSHYVEKSKNQDPDLAKKYALYNLQNT